MKLFFKYALAILLLTMIWTACQRSDRQQPSATKDTATISLKDQDLEPAGKEASQLYPGITSTIEPYRFADPGFIPENSVPEQIEYYVPLPYIPVKDEVDIAGMESSYDDGNKEANHIISRDPFNIPSFKRLKISEEKRLSIIFDNDIFSNTDYYYTSGLSIELFHPYLKAIPTSYLLPSAGNGSVNHYSISLTQTLYTPVDPDQNEIQDGDRPFASYLVLGHSKLSNNSVENSRLSSRLDLGVIGSAAMGGLVQKTIHQIEPIGWQNQVSNDFVFNYFLQFEKGMALGRHIELIGKVAGSAGTLFTNASLGGSIRFSNGAGYFESAFLNSVSENSKPRLNYFVMLTMDGTLVGYDATLQGGLFSSPRNVYIISADQVSRGVMHSRLSAGLNFGWFTLELEHQFLTPEFKGGKNFMWSRIKTSFKI